MHHGTSGRFCSLMAPGKISPNIIPFKSAPRSSSISFFSAISTKNYHTHTHTTRASLVITDWRMCNKKSSLCLPRQHRGNKVVTTLVQFVLLRLQKKKGHLKCNLRQQPARSLQTVISAVVCLSRRTKHRPLCSLMTGASSASLRSQATGDNRSH